MAFPIVIDQIRKIPESTTDLVVSAGGNDGLPRADIQTPSHNVNTGASAIRLSWPQFALG
jgi:hypothetical protein